ncbi:MAG TPA: VCBS repeat-containing protein, partial [Pseudomonadota bacterium]|nr:VCBS repeat-containing protein [Pseudomonadota bacterium]
PGAITDSSVAMKKVLYTDLNGDGKVDLAVAQTGPQPQVEYAIGKGDGTFTVAGKVNTSLTVGTLALVDVNHDRKADLIIPDGSFLNTFLSNGDGTFGSAIPLVHSFQPIDSNCALAVGDVNGDGEVDILLTTPRDARTGVFLGRGNGMFVELAAVSNGSILEQPVLADLNGDKKLDLALVDRSHSQVVVFQGDGKGGFSQVSVNPGTKYPDSIGVADMNGDGTLDLVTIEANGLGETFQILAGYGDGQFLRGAKYTIGATALATSLFVGDLNGDNKPEVVIAQRSGKLGLFKNVTP